MDASPHAHLDLSPDLGGGIVDLGGIDKKAFASDDVAPPGLENATPPGKQLLLLQRLWKSNHQQTHLSTFGSELFC